MAVQTRLLVCNFDGETRADDARQAIEALDQRLDTVRLGNIGILSKDEEGTIKYWETAEVAEQSRSSAFGMAAGWLLGALGMFLGTPFGPAHGGLAGELIGAGEPFNREHGFPDEELRHLAESLEAGHSLLLTLVRPEEAPIVAAELEGLGGRLIEQTLPREIVERLSDSSDTHR
jgi:uncharacterized membrane protein